MPRAKRWCLQVFKGLTLVWAIAIMLVSAVLLPATISYLRQPTAELVSITPLVLRISLIALTIGFCLEMGMVGILAYVEARLRREWLLFMGIHAVLCCVTTVLLLQLNR